MRISRLITCALLMWLLAPSTQARQMLNLPDHPRLLVDSKDVTAVRAKIKAVTWAKTYYASLARNAEGWLAQPVVLPDRGGQWWHWYACPKHGARLKTESPTRHVCPVDGQVFSGYPYDDVVLSAKHDELAHAVRDLGLVYQISGDKRYAAKSREILLAYAAKYLSYPLHDINGKSRIGGGRVLPQTLDESIWLISMAQGADMVWDTLSEADREQLKTKLFYPAAVDVIQKHKMLIHNIQCWKNTAVGLVGLLYGDKALVDDAIDGPFGYRAQTSKGVQADGAWFEGAWGYHFYTMDALHGLTEAARHCGIDLYGDAYKRMFVAPIELAMPDGKLPAFNDSGAATANGNANYEIALARYGDARFAKPLQSSNRQNLQALICGVEPLPSVTTADERSHNDTVGGYAILRSGKGPNATWLCLKYGPHGGGHGHPDKNSFVLYANGKIVAGDPGSAAYGAPIHGGWCRTTLAHNTLTVDETSQQPATGSCLDYQTNTLWSGALVDAGTAIDGVTYRRAAFLLGQDAVAFIDMAHSTGGERTFDFALHPYGQWESQPGNATTFTAPDKPGYSYLSQLQSIATADGARYTLADQGAKRSICFDAGAMTTYISGYGVGSNTEEHVPVVIARQKGVQALVVWAVTLKPGMAVPEWRQPAPIAPAGHVVSATLKLGATSWVLTVNGDHISAKPKR